MSDDFDFSAFVSENPNLAWALDESGDVESSSTVTSPTGTTVITVGPLSGKRHDPGQSLQSIPSHESQTVEAAEAMEGYFSFDKLVQENPNLSWAAASIEGKLLDLHDPGQSLQSVPSHKSPSVKVSGAGEEYFSFDKLIQENPNLSWAAAEVEDKSSSSDSMMRDLLQPPPSTRVLNLPQEISQSSLSPSQTSSQEGRCREEKQEEEPLAAAMPFQPGVSSPSEAVTPRSDRSNYSDSLDLLPSPPSMRHSESLRKRRLSSIPPPQTSFQDGASLFQPQPELLETTSFGRCSPSTEQTTSHKNKRRRSEPGSTSQTSSASENVSTPARLTETILGDLDAKSALFLARQLSPPKMHRPPVKKPPISTAIDPYAVGLVAMHEVLRDGARLTKELRRDARALKLPRRRDLCVCDVTRHPSWWPVDRIQDVHSYSFLLDCQDVVMSRANIVAANNSETIVVCNVPMDHINPMKLKAEEVLRFVDVEIGYGDQTCNNLFHYVQPLYRKVLLALSYGRVVGIVVAEEVPFAHRILRETVRFMELEENPVPVRVGINRLWVHISERRRYLATLLCRLIGRCFYENKQLQDEDYAFNNYSDAMVMFAKVFLKTLRPPLYCQMR